MFFLCMWVASLFAFNEYWTSRFKDEIVIGPKG